MLSYCEFRISTCEHSNCFRIRICIIFCFRIANFILRTCIFSNLDWADKNSQDEIRDSKLLPIVWKRGIRNSKFCRFFRSFCEFRMEFGSELRNSAIYSKFDTQNETRFERANLDSFSKFAIRFAIRSLRISNFVLRNSQEFGLAPALFIFLPKNDRPIIFVVRQNGGVGTGTLNVDCRIVDSWTNNKDYY